MSELEKIEEKPSQSAAEYYHKQSLQAAALLRRYYDSESTQRVEPKKEELIVLPHEVDPKAGTFEETVPQLPNLNNPDMDEVLSGIFGEKSTRAKSNSGASEPIDLDFFSGKTEIGPGLTPWL